MNIPDIKHLQAVIKLCRKEGVEIIKIDGIELVLGKLPEKKPAHKPAAIPESISSYSLGNIDENVQIPITELDIPTDSPTEDQLLFGSSDPSVWPTANQ